MRKKKANQSITAGADSLSMLAGRDINILLDAGFPTELVDQKIEDEIARLCKARMFAEFDTVGTALSLGTRLAELDLAKGSNSTRARALALCARFLSPTDEAMKAEEFLEFAKTLGHCQEIKIAEAFFMSKKGERAAALSTLERINSPASRSAALIVVMQHDSAEGAIQWMGDAGIAVEQLDSDGKARLLVRQLELANWVAATQTLKAVAESDLEEAPILYHLVAITKLLAAVPTEFRSIVVTEVPFDAFDFRLASTDIAMDARRAAHRHFLDAVEVAQDLECSRAARLDDEYALWLELRDPEQAAHGRARLEAELRDPTRALGRVPFALQFGIKLDIGAVERDIEREIARNGEVTLDAALARLALAFAQKTPEEAADYIVRYQSQLSTYINTKYLHIRQIEMLSKAGLHARAASYFDELMEQGISPDEQNRIRVLLAAAKGNDPIEALREQYTTTEALGDLINLVDKLEASGSWDEVSTYGSKLFESTHSLRDAERLVKGFNNTLNSKAIIEFLEGHTDLLPQSSLLKISYAWALYNEGKIRQARVALAQIPNGFEDANYRTLQINIGITSGDWDSLPEHIAREYQNRENRSAQELLSAARLALHLGSPLAKPLAKAAVAMGEENADIQAGAYFLATSAGWESDPEVYQWLERAATLSGDEGPLRRMSLKDLLEHKPEWDRQASETSRMLEHGETPIFLAAQSLNKSLIDLTVFPALANPSESDLRRTGVIPAFSGKRMPTPFDLAKKAIGFEVTALLTLDFLGILDTVLDACSEIYLPHTTLALFFEERQHAAFHQPSRIKRAHELRQLLATDMLERFSPNTVANSELSAQVGDELAALIAEAEHVSEGDSTQRIVVRSSPVHRVSTLMEEEADLASHASILSSCYAVVVKLRQKGQITAAEEKRARAYFQLHEKPWPNQPQISDGAILYLDDLTITYFLHLGMLGKIKAAGLTGVVSSKAASDANALISYEGISSQIEDIIEHIRALLSVRLETGKIKLGNRFPSADSNEGSHQHPTASIISLIPDCDVLIIDDRFINQHPLACFGSAHAEIYSTLDVLDTLYDRGDISAGQRLEYRTQLRLAGYIFVPVSKDEVKQYLKNADVVDGRVVETAELRAVRRSILRIRMSNCLQLPEEAPWLQTLVSEYSSVLHSCWKNEVDFDEARAQSNWIAEQLDLRGWAHSLGPDNGDNFVRIGRGAFILGLLTPPVNAAPNVLDAYWTWSDQKILAPIKEQFPDLYTWLVEQYREKIAAVADAEFTQDDFSL